MLTINRPNLALSLKWSLYLSGLPLNSSASGKAGFLRVILGHLNEKSRFICKSESPFGSVSGTIASMGHFRLADPAVDTFVGMDDEHVLALIEAVHGADFHAVGIFAFDADIGDDEGHGVGLKLHGGAVKRQAAGSLAGVPDAPARRRGGNRDRGRGRTGRS